MSTISPTEWLQYGALGLLGLGMLIAAIVVRSVLMKLLEGRAQEQMALIEVLQSNAAVLAGLTVSIQGMQFVMLRCRSNAAFPPEK